MKAQKTIAECISGSGVARHRPEDVVVAIMPRKVVVNRCFGGFHLSPEAVKLIGCEDARSYTYTGEDYSNKRDDPKLVAAVEKLGSKRASGRFAHLVVVEIPDDVGDNWFIDEYDGSESIHENHRSW